jgi:hypothetical protein
MQFFGVPFFAVSGRRSAPCLVPHYVAPGVYHCVFILYGLDMSLGQRLYCIYLCSEFFCLLLGQVNTFGLRRAEEDGPGRGLHTEPEPATDVINVKHHLRDTTGSGRRSAGLHLPSSDIRVRPLGVLFTFFALTALPLTSTFIFLLQGLQSIILTPSDVIMFHVL